VVNRCAAALACGAWAAGGAIACAEIVPIPERYYTADGAADATSGGDGADQSASPDGAAPADAPANSPPLADAPAGDAPPNPLADGGCTPGCDSAGICILACNQDFPGHIALDAENVYWANLGIYPGSAGGGVLRVGKTGTNVITLAGPGALSPQGLVADSGCVYWHDGAHGTIVALCGSSAPTTPVTDLTADGQFTAAGTTLVWVTEDGGLSTISACTLPDCSAPHALKTDDYNSPFGLGIATTALTSTGLLYWLEGPPTSVGLVYNCALSNCSASARALTILVAPLSLAVLPNGDYALTTGSTSGSDGTIDYFEYASGTTYRQTSGRSGPVGIATDGTSACWAEPGDGGNGVIACCDIQFSNAPCSPKILAIGLPFPNAVAIDATHAYWVNGGDGYTPSGSVMSSPR
jgi:hypothetical protein